MTPKTLEASYIASDYATNFERKTLKGKLGSIKAMNSTLSDKESLVAEEYNKAFLSHCRGKKIPASVIRVCNCDAYWVGKYNVLVEYKYDIDMENPIERAKVIAQVVAYYRAIANHGKVKNATVIFVADVNECFALHVNYLNKFVNLAGVAWVAPSKMGEDPILVNALVADRELHEKTIVFNTADADFDEKKIFNSIDEIAGGVTRIVPITEGTVKMGFEYFSTKIVDTSKYKGTANDLVGMYFEFIKGDDNCFVRNGKLYFSKYPAISVNATKATQFKSRFGVFSENDKAELERMFDTLLTDTERRFNGQFFTPKVWVDEAHRRMEKVLGEDWESVIPTWDCCCGTKSLTRDYEFGNLWLSTLEQSELNASENLSTEARETFVFDFLNGDMRKLPSSLLYALKKGGKFAFIINPPYGQATSGRGTDHKEGISETATLNEMKTKGMGKAGLELTVQFLWRIMSLVKEYNLTDVTLGLFSNPNWMTGDSFEEFRKEWLKVATFNNGVAFSSDEFEGVKSGWAINFSVWKLSKKNNNTTTPLFPCDIMERSNDGFGVIKSGEHTYYNLDGSIKASDWVRGPLPKTAKTFATTDGISIMDSSDSRCRGTICDGSLGYFACNSNIVEKNAQMIALFSLPFSCANGFNLLPENIDRAVALFAARKMVDSTPFTTRDSYMAPDTTSQQYPTFVADAYILSLVYNGANQTSIKGTHNGVDYDFKNQFYPFTKAETYEMLSLEKKQNFKDDIRFCRATNKFVGHSTEAKRVLDAFARCITETATARPTYHKGNPELQVNRWDAGYRQLKVLFEEAAPEAFKELKAATKALKEKMLPQVYELGFLKK